MAGASRLGRRRQGRSGASSGYAFGVGLPARRATRGTLHLAAGTALSVGAAAAIVAVLGVAPWVATMIVTGVIAVLVVVAAAYVLSRP
jgi:hypothetical protein